MGDKQGPIGPDLSTGVALADVPEGGMIGGHVGEVNVLLARQKGELFALSAKCTHYGGRLNKGLIVGETRCAVRGITPVSACAAVRRWRHRR